MSEVKSYVRRFGKSVEADEVFHAWTSQDFQRMERAVGLPTNAIDRHFLLQTLVAQCFRLRKEPGMVDRLLRYGTLHLEELPTLIQALREERGNGPLYRITTYANVAWCLDELGRSAEAEGVFRLAAAHGAIDEAEVEQQIHRLRSDG